MTPTEAPPFEEHCTSALEGLRSALVELYHAAGADPDAPQEVSRSFGLNRNLTWKISRIIRAEHPQQIFQHLPGASGLQILIDGFGRTGVPEERGAAVLAAAEEYERMVAVHAGDRATLELMLDSLDPEGAPAESLEVSRKLAFRGNSGVWGIQARVRLRTVFIAPDPERPEWLDTAQISGLVDLRRFRHGAVWPLFEREVFDDDGAPRGTSEEAIDPKHGGEGGSMLIEEFCSKPLPEMRVVPIALGKRYELVGGSLGNRGRTTCVYGSYQRRFAPRHRDDHNVRGEFFTSINAPSETLLFDLILHEDVFAEMNLEVRVLHAGSDGPYLGRSGVEIPCPERLRVLGTSPPNVVTPLVPRYGEIVGRVYERLGWDPRKFKGVRLEMKYPPLSSSVVLSSPLPEGS